MKINKWLALVSFLCWLDTLYTCGSSEGCHYWPEIYDLTCYKRVNVSGVKISVRQVTICNYSDTNVNIDNILEKFPNVVKINITGGNATNITWSNKQSNLKVLRLAKLHLTTLESDLSQIPSHLNILDLRDNHIRVLEKYETYPEIPSIYLSGNPWNCTADISWILNATNVKDVEEVKCNGTLYPDKPVLRIAQFLQNIETNCPEQCECTMPEVVKEPATKNLNPIIDVNCSDRGLTELPSILPQHTKILWAKRNLIESLEPLVQNPHYRNLQDLHLDHNVVSELEILEGSFWLSQFRVLSLAGNRLSQLPTYAVDNALQQNPNMPMGVRVYLGSNPWRCDCVFTPGFQDMLRKYVHQMYDLSDIKCSYVEGDENSLLPIVELSRSSVCRLPSEYSVRALDLLNVVLASLIILVLGKLAYDYYYFKRTGKLPWIVTKMP